jgi:FAD/FMN-containing dehydrogenase
MRPFTLVLACLPSALTSTYASQHAALQHALAELTSRLSPGAIVTLPSSPRWRALQIRSSSPAVAPSYGAVVEVATEGDVIATVSIAGRCNVPFLAISGAHGWTRTLNRMEHGIQINMRALNGVTLGSGGRAADLGGGALQWEITRELYARGKYAGEYARTHGNGLI